MYLSHHRAGAIFISTIAALSLCGCGGWWKTGTPRAAQTASPPPTGEAASADFDSTEVLIRSLEERVKSDPEDFVAYAKLGGYYLERSRETGDVKYVELASRAARASLDLLPAERNPGALSVLAQAEFASHNFVAARDHAQRLVGLAPRKSQPYLLLADALLELGDYERAEEALGKAEQGGERGVGSETRRARFELLRGDFARARARLLGAAAAALEQVPPSRETVAWCRWQAGEVTFASGDYERAESLYLDALAGFPDYHRALASLARVRAAREDLQGAIEYAERAVRVLPDPSYVAALGDLYQLAGRDRDAAAQYALVEQIARLGALGGALYNRNLALFYADHDMNPEKAFALASAEYGVRRDVYGADVLAWAALKAGKIGEAESAMREALKLGTRDAKLFYHAGMIAHAAGDEASAKDYLKRALELNPQFDPLQARRARQMLES
jgi:tetratricopeptide (TPR) repeat protein